MLAVTEKIIIIYTVLARHLQFLQGLQPVHVGNSNLKYFKFTLILACQKKRSTLCLIVCLVDLCLFAFFLCSVSTFPLQISGQSQAPCCLVKIFPENLQWGLTAENIFSYKKHQQKKRLLVRLWCQRLRIKARRYSSFFPDLPFSAGVTQGGIHQGGSGGDNSLSADSCLRRPQRSTKGRRVACEALAATLCLTG